jgi:hypothetical protein
MQSCSDDKGPAAHWPPCWRDGGPNLCENRIELNLSGGEVCYTNSLILLVKNILCSNLHCQKDFGLLLFSYKTAFFSPRDLHVSPPEPGDLWYRLGGSKETIWSRSEGWRSVYSFVWQHWAWTLKLCVSFFVFLAANITKTICPPQKCGICYTENLQDRNVVASQSGHVYQSGRFWYQNLVGIEQVVAALLAALSCGIWTTKHSHRAKHCVLKWPPRWGQNGKSWRFVFQDRRFYDEVKSCRPVNVTDSKNHQFQLWGFDRW